jgi:hypothetical protein
MGRLSDFPHSLRELRLVTRKRLSQREIDELNGFDGVELAFDAVEPDHSAKTDPASVNEAAPVQATRSPSTLKSVSRVAALGVAVGVLLTVKKRNRLRR